jgi:histidine kinase/DNA gyrase B/HSP90-like ATPase
MPDSTPALPSVFTMEFEATTIEHLGLKLYSSLPPVIGELVSNAWDADASRVDIEFPQGDIQVDSQVTVTDNGHGMEPLEVQQKYLFIGRNRRVEENSNTSAGGRLLTGRKGLGKLSAFGIADQIEVRTVHDGFAVTILLDYSKMKSWPRGKPYEPQIISTRSGVVNEANGTTVTIRELRRKKPIGAEWIRRELARRFRFIGSKFKVYINGTQIKPADRRQRVDCRAAWDVSELKPGDVVDGDSGWKVGGWIGIVEKSSQTERGVDIFARGKAVELDTMFNLKTTHVQFARSYVVGEISADFLDADEDRISTARNSVNWESEAGQKLQAWGEQALKDVFDRWLKLQHEEKERKIVRSANFDEWLATRTTREQKVAKRLLKLIVDDPNIEPESAGPLLEIIKTNVEFQAFQDLVDEIEDSGASVHTLIKLFRDWRVIEAREHLKLSDGRLEAMEKLSSFIEDGALEVQDMQPLFEGNAWLIDPTWGGVSGQTTYTKLLRKQFPESNKVPEEDRRLDLLGIRVSSEIDVVELKRPEKRLSRDDLSQIESYVDWARANLVGTGDDAPRYARGLLIVGKLNDKKDIHEKAIRLAGDDIRVETYGDLLQRARRVYGEVQERLKNIAPEYTQRARRSSKKKRRSKKGS